MSDYKFNRKRHVRMLFQLRRMAFFAAVVSAALYLTACAPRQSSVNSEAQTNTTTTSTTQTTTPNAEPADAAPPIVSAHGGSVPPMSSSGGGGGMPPSSTGKPDVDTAALDAKIAQAERKAKASGASEADKRAAAAAYLERGNVFYNAGQPSLYKFALRDLRRTLRYEPNNTQAREEVDTIVAIYQGMNRPVPELGNEP